MAVSNKEVDLCIENQLLDEKPYLRERCHRIPTPDKQAIMTLSRSGLKHRLGKQQQVLQDVTHKCREQEIADLSGSITRKVILSESLPKDVLAQMFKTNDASVLKGNESDSSLSNAGGYSSGTGGGASNFGESEINTSIDKGSTEGFPTRRVLRSPRKETTFSTGLPRLSISYRKGVTPSDQHYHRAVLLNQHQINGQIQFNHYTQPRVDPLAPLVLPNIGSIGLDNNNVSSYIQAKRITIRVAPRGTKASIRISAKTGVL